MPLFPSHMRTRVMDPQEHAAQRARIPDAGATAAHLLKRYRPLETNTSGGFGMVEICLDARLQRRVAIKRIPLVSPDAAGITPAETTAAALGEARTASLLSHPNIVSVIDFTYDASYAYLVMEYVDGMNLEEFLAGVEGHSLTFDEAATIADALVQALSFAHENGVLHLDIKPANVLIDRNGHVKLADFGMATLTSAAGFGGARGGTIGYMPPEQLRGDLVDARTDVFALACVLYEALCGTAPFRAGTPADSEARIDQGVLYPSDLLPDIPPSAEEALLAALSPDPAMRPVSIAAFGELFCAELGNVREGKRSLAAIIARLTSDDMDDIDAEQPTRAERTWELDPAEGYLGSRTEHARDALAALVAAASVAACCWVLLGATGLVTAAGRIAAALAIGLAAGVAPQLGSALIFTGFLVTIVGATPLLSMLPVGALAAAVGSAWWLVWGRTDPQASACLTLACALEATLGDAMLAAPLAAALAGCTTYGAAAPSSVGVGLVLGQLLRAACAAAGALPFEAAATALASLGFLTPAIGWSLVAWGISAVMAWAWSRYLDGRGAGAYALAYTLPIAASIALLCLAHPMEIATLPTPLIATAVGVGIASSIMLCIYVYLFGYRKHTTGV